MSIVPRVVREASTDWVKFDAQLARDGSVDPTVKAVYAAIASFADQGDRQTDPDPDGNDIPYRKVLAACIGRSVDTLDRAIKVLEEELGLLEVERRQDPDNPKQNLPSVYRLLDHERWDERAAARAAERQRKREEAKRRREQAAEEKRRKKEGGGRTDAATPEGGGRTGAARGGRTSAAVPLPSKKTSLSQEGEAAAPPVKEGEERETTAAPDNPETPPPADRSTEAQAIAKAWTQGTGLPRVPASEREMQRQAAELLEEGHDAIHLAAVARWMGTRGWRDLGLALTASGAPRILSARPAPKRETARCDKHPYGNRDSVGRCLTCNAEASGIKTAVLSAAPPPAPTGDCEQHGPHNSEQCPRCVFQARRQEMHNRIKAGKTEVPA